MIGQRVAVGQRLLFGLCVTLMFASLGCDKEKTDTALSDAGAQIEDAGDAIAENVDKAVEKGEEAAKDAGDKAKELGEKAMAYITPLKEKFGDLESLKEKPEELKTAVSELITSLEEKTENLELPEAVSNSLAAAKEKLIALRDYLGGEIDQAKIDEHLKEIGDAMKGALGMS